jgi:hypothetical protein
VREGTAWDEWRNAYVNTHLNPADLLTKPLSGSKRWSFVRMLLHWLAPAKDVVGEDKNDCQLVDTSSN